MKKICFIITIILFTSSLLNAKRSCYDAFTSDYNQATLSLVSIQTDVWNTALGAVIGSWSNYGSVFSAAKAYIADTNLQSILSNAQLIYNIALDNISTNYWNCVCSNGACG